MLLISRLMRGRNRLTAKKSCKFKKKIVKNCPSVPAGHNTLGTIYAAYILKQEEIDILRFEGRLLNHLGNGDHSLT